MPTSITDNKLNNSTSVQKVILSFQTLADISNFKKECNCNDFYVDRDSLSLVGTFTDEQLQLAVNKYSAVSKMDKE